MPVIEAQFDAWLQPVLLDKDIDYDVYGSYIVSILSDEGDDDSKKEAIAEILQSFMVSRSFMLLFYLQGMWGRGRGDLKF